MHDKNRINQKGEGSFDKAFKNGLWLKKHGLDHIKMTFSKEDINYIAPSLKFFLENGFKHIETIVRNIPNKRQPKKTSPTNQTGKTVSTMTHEYIVIMKKED